MPDNVRQELAKRIENAFQDGQYPGDDNLVYDNRDGIYLDPDVIQVKQDFLGKHWKDLSPDTINYNRNNLSFFTAEAFCFYLPAFLTTSVLYPIEVVDVLPGNLISHLKPHSEIPELDDELIKVLNILTAQQKRVVVEFMIWYENAYTPQEFKHLDSFQKRAIRFWNEIIQSL